MLSCLMYVLRMCISHFENTFVKFIIWVIWGRGVASFKVPMKKQDVVKISNIAVPRNQHRCTEMAVYYFKMSLNPSCMKIFTN